MLAFVLASISLPLAIYQAGSDLPRLDYLFIMLIFRTNTRTSVLLTRDWAWGLHGCLLPGCIAVRDEKADVVRLNYDTMRIQ